MTTPPRVSVRATSTIRPCVEPARAGAKRARARRTNRRRRCRRCRADKARFRWVFAGDAVVVRVEAVGSGARAVKLFASMFGQLNCRLEGYRSRGTTGSTTPELSRRKERRERDARGDVWGDEVELAVVVPVGDVGGQRDPRAGADVAVAKVLSLSRLHRARRHDARSSAHDPGPRVASSSSVGRARED